VKAAFSYAGGKQRMASRIVKLLPKHTVYVEPFVGGAAVLCAKPWPEVGSLFEGG
jgi:DNA adenine methylase